MNTDKGAVDIDLDKLEAQPSIDALVDSYLTHGVLGDVPNHRAKLMQLASESARLGRQVQATEAAPVRGAFLNTQGGVTLCQNSKERESFGFASYLYAAPTAQEVTHQAAKAETGSAQALADMEARKDAAYLERNQVVAALAKCFPSGVARTAIGGWSEDWHGCVYIDLPTGQASWHFHDSQAYLFDGLPPYAGKWDGHTTEEKYERISRLAPTTSTVSAPGVQHIPANFTTHRTAWRDAITECINVETQKCNHDQVAYWQHELDAYDRAFARLLDNPEPVKSEVAQAAPDASEQAAAFHEFLSLGEFYYSGEGDFDAWSTNKAIPLDTLARAFGYQNAVDAIIDALGEPPAPFGKPSGAAYASATRQAAPEAPTEPIYQVYYYSNLGGWRDVNMDQYNSARKQDRRIVYAAPEAPALTRALREVYKQQVDPKLATTGATAYERFLYAELTRLQSAVIADAAPEAPAQLPNKAIPMCEGCDDPAKVYPDGSTGLCDACQDFGNNDAPQAASQQAGGNFRNARTTVTPGFIIRDFDPPAGLVTTAASLDDAAPARAPQAATTAAPEAPASEQQYDLVGNLKLALQRIKSSSFLVEARSFADVGLALIEMDSKATTASASIDTPEFRALADDWARASWMGWTRKEIQAKWDLVIAHIDSRAPAPSREAAPLDEKTSGGSNE